MKPFKEIAGTPKLQANLLFGELLVSKGLLTREQLTEALNQQRNSGGRLGEVLVAMGMLRDEDIMSVLGEHLSMERLELDDLGVIDGELARELPESLAKRYCALVVADIDGKAVVAMADPLNVVAIDTIKLKLKRELKVVVSSAGAIERAIEFVYHGSDVEEQHLRDLVEVDGEDCFEDQEDLRMEGLTEGGLSGEEAASKAPVIRFVDIMLRQAVKSRASDVHIEPQDKSMNIRMRVDGSLRDMVGPSRKMQAGVIARIKILADVNIAERRLPQDGRFRMRASGREVDIRVSVLPTIYGEKVVMRILDAAGVNHDINRIGFEPQLLSEFKGVLSQPHGIILVTGPTGSGKSTTLYSALNYLKDPRKNITTVEDPVEYRLAGINQVQVKPDIGLDFAACLRSILRQDPDIVLIGEMRDKETVEIAIKASLTGHLVLSTFHTNDAPSAVSRLRYMGIEPYLLASSLNLVVAQRLVRRVCEKCRERVELSEKVLGRLNIDAERAREGEFYRGRGCKSCDGTGYSGRVPVFEFFMVNNDIREMVIRGATESELRQVARNSGYGGLLESGVVRMLEGLTTAEEVLSVSFNENVREVAGK